MVSAPRPQEILRNVSILVDGRVCGFGVIEAFVLDNINSINVEFREGLTLRNDAQLSNILTPPKRSSVVFKHHASNNNEVNDENHIGHSPVRDKQRNQPERSDHHNKENSKPSTVKKRYRSSEKKKENPFVTPARKSSSTFKDVPNNPNNSCTRTITPKGAKTPETLASTCTTPRNLEDEENKEYERLLQNSGKKTSKLDKSDRKLKDPTRDLNRGKKAIPRQRKFSPSKKSKPEEKTQETTTPKRKKTLDPEVLPTPIVKPTQKDDLKTPSSLKRRSGSFSCSTPAIPPKRGKEESKNNSRNTVEVEENVQNTPSEMIDNMPKNDQDELSPQFSDEDGNLAPLRYAGHRPSETSRFLPSSDTEQQDQQYKRMMKSEDNQKLIQSEGFWL